MSAQTITDIDYTGDVTGEVQDEVGATTPAYALGTILGVEGLSSHPTGTISIEGAQDLGSGTLSIEGEYGTLYFFPSLPSTPSIGSWTYVLSREKATPINGDENPTESFTLTYTVTDATTGATTNYQGDVTVTVAGVDDPFYFAEDSYSFSVNENTPSETLVGKLEVSDPDSTPNLNYSIIAGTSSPFAIDNNGNITVNGDLDYESGTTEYTLTIQVTDNDATTITTEVTIQVANLLEPLMESYTVELDEDADIGATVTNISVSNADTVDTLRYAFVLDAQGTTGLVDGAFTINAGTGAITLTGALDYETARTHTLDVEITDGTQTVATTVTVNVNDVNEHAPTFVEASYTATLAEDSATDGSVVVASPLAKDADADKYTDDDSTVSYAFVLDEQGTTGLVDGAFTINAETGVITLTGALDYETATTHSLTVQASDGKHMPTTTVDIQVGNVIEFSMKSYEVDVKEDVVANTKVAEVEAEDIFASIPGVPIQVPVAVSYFFVDGENHGLFRIEAGTGKIYLTGELDYESGVTEYTLEVYASARDLLSEITTVTIDVENVNDTSPEFTQTPYTATLRENVAVGATVVTISTEDPDNIGTVSYAFVLDDQDTTGLVDGAFTINAETGVITLTSALDYETATTHSLTVQASDGKYMPTTTVTVNVDNVIEFPIASYEVDVNEDVVANTKVAEVEAEDVFASIPGVPIQVPVAVSYFFVDDKDYDLFRIEAGTGKIYLTGELDYESGVTEYTLEVYASARDLPSAIATVTIDVEDVNDMSPVFAQTPDTVTLKEDVAVGTTVVTISADDPDTVGTISYAFVLDDQGTTGLVDGAFTINADTGVITLTGALDYETATTHSLKVQASDGEHPPITTTVTVDVTDVNDNAPAITIRGAYMGSVDESDAGADTGLTFIVKDADANANATFTTNSFGISHATDATLARKFEVVTLRDENGAVKVDADGNTIWTLKLKSTASLDYGTDNAHKLAITVNDGAKDSPARNVTVNVEKAIHGTSGNDTLTGTAEGENIYGNAGNDTITGGGGRDIIYGGAGLDKLTGGAGDDTFYLDTANAVASSNADIVTDFTRNSNGGDHIRLDIDGIGRQIEPRDLESLQDIANIRWEVAGKTVAGSNSGSDSDTIDNTIIYYTQGTDTESDDVILMVLEDFSDSLTLEMFNLVITAGDQWFDYGGAGDDIIYGSAGRDWLYGDFGYNQSGEDVIHGGAGDDSIYGGYGSDTLYGNDGNDHIRSGANGGAWDRSNNVIYGGHGDDNISGGDGNDALYGEEDNDDIYGNRGHDRIDGGDGNDHLDGGRGIDILYGRGGDDVFYSDATGRYHSDRNIVADFREDGTDRVGLQISTSADVVRFTTIEELKSIANIRFDNTTNKVISGHETRENDASVMDTVIYHTRGTSNESDDRIVVVLEDFADELTIDMFDIDITTSGGDKVIYGNDGNSEIQSGSGDDVIYGGKGNDLIEGWVGNDIIYGGAGDDRLFGIANAGRSINDIDGGDILYGGEGNDYLSGAQGDDRHYGGEGNDTFYDYKGDDWFFGGRGIDIIDGGDGYDIFYLDIEEVEAGNTNVIEDFVRDGQRGIDRIRVDVSGADKTAIESLTTDAMKLDKLKELADIRWTSAHINAGDTRSDSQSVRNTVIYNTLGTENKNDDIILMVLEDFTHELTFEMFEVAIGGTENGDTIRGSNFDDNIYSHAGNDSIYGGDGADRIESGDGNDNIWGEGGNDIIDSGNGIDKIWGGTGDNIFYLNNKALGVNTNIVGDFSVGDNQIRVRVNDNQVTTLAELKSAANIRWEVTQKNVAGYRPTDSGSTDDAGVDNTIIYRIVGKDDSLTTNTETDDIMLMVLEDYVTPLTMNMFSLIIGASRSSRDITAGPGDDIISGNGGWDYFTTIRGGDGNDIIKGRYGESTIYGEGGNDIIYGNAKDDFIDGGAGIDIMFGYYGDDIFSLDTSALAGNTDIVMDFREIGADLLRVDTVSGDEDTFTELGIRVDNNENKIIAGFETGENDASVMDSVIYRVVGTPDNAPNHQGPADDIMLMVLEDFTSLDMSMFDVM